jgi:hypothetical protein
MCAKPEGAGQKKAKQTNLLRVGVVAVGARQERAVVARVARVAHAAKDFERIPCEGIVGHGTVTDGVGARGDDAVDGGELGQSVHV